MEVRILAPLGSASSCARAASIPCNVGIPIPAKRPESSRLTPTVTCAYRSAEEGEHEDGKKPFHLNLLKQV